MEKPNYQEILNESKSLAMDKKRRPIMYAVTLLVAAFFIYSLFSLCHFLINKGNKPADVAFVVMIVGMIEVLFVAAINFIKFDVDVSKDQVSDAIKEILLQKESEYLEEMNDCSDNLTYINEAILAAEHELSLAKQNLIDFKDIKQAFDALY